ncbi:MAG: dephospho-CoA kinase [Moraxellaceae bacterium]
MTYTIGLTGGIGSGKTAASDWFAAQGISVVDADVVAREIVALGQPALAEIADTFGADMLNTDGSLNRAAMREYIFNTPNVRQQLEAITHPRIRAEIIRQLAGATSSYALLVSPLLFETNQHELVQQTILIDVPETLQLSRASQRDGQTAESIQRIMQAQMSRAERQQRATHVILNDRSLKDLHGKLAILHQRLLNDSQTT